MFEALDVSEGCDMHGGFLNLNLPRQLYILGILCHERICPESWVHVTGRPEEQNTASARVKVHNVAISLFQFDSCALNFDIAV